MFGTWTDQHTVHRTKKGLLRTVSALCAVYCVLCAGFGCAAISSPVANGIPVRYVPPELLGESKEGLETIPLTALRQPPPTEYLLGPNDILGVWIEGILGDKGQPPPVQLPTAANQTPAIGYPVPVRGDGSISLPLIEPIKIKDMTLEKAQLTIQKAYIDKQILQPGKERALVTLQRPRHYSVLVIRQDSSEGGDTGSGSGTGGLTIGFSHTGSTERGSRRGTGFALHLPAYENDLLNALARTGGFPGTDAVNEVVIERGTYKADEAGGIPTLPGHLPKADQLGGDGKRQQIRIPLRVRPGQPLGFKPEDVILQSGDIVFIESRGADLFYTAGLLPPGEYVLPRDSDLDIIEAITKINGVINSGGLNANNISGGLLSSGIGFPSPSLATVLRRGPCGGQVPIRVDLNRALKDERERILIMPGDVVMLQERPQEAMARYFNSNFNFTLVWKTFLSNRVLGTTTVSVP